MLIFYVLPFSIDMIVFSDLTALNLYFLPLRVILILFLYNICYVNTLI